MSNENETETVRQEEPQTPVTAEQPEVVSAVEQPVAEPAAEPAAESPAVETEEPIKNGKPAFEPIPVTEEMVERTRNTLAMMLDYLGLDGTIKAEGKPNKINLLIASQDAGRIIGRKGQALDSLQTLLNRMMQKGDERFPKIYIDIDGYSSNSKHSDRFDGERRGPRGPRFNRGGHFHERSGRGERFDRAPRGERGDFERGGDDKEDQLRQQALDSAKEVRRWGEPVTLPPMNAHDRRIIHITLENETDLHTESNGDGNFKSVVISLKKEENA